mgnify:CR=1 FL=1
MKHGEKIVDGIQLQYICQPCPECKAKLQAAEEMAGILKYTHREFAPYHWVFYDDCRVCKLLAAWEKAGK